MRRVFATGRTQASFPALLSLCASEPLNDSHNLKETIESAKKLHRHFAFILPFMVIILFAITNLSEYSRDLQGQRETIQHTNDMLLESGANVDRECERH